MKSSVLVRWKRVLTQMALTACALSTLQGCGGFASHLEASSWGGPVSGDMILEHDPRLNARASVDFFDNSSTTWSDGKMPVQFDDAINDAQRNLFWKACREWSSASDFACVARGQETTYLRVTVDSTPTTGTSMVGSGAAWAQPNRIMTLGSRLTYAVILHEIGHAMGFAHEHQRPDRDTYVAIRLVNVLPGTEGNFIVARHEDASRAYDFDSIMHYSPTVFSVNGQPTIVAQPPYAERAKKMGQGTHLSDGDRISAASLYGYTPEPNPMPLNIYRFFDIVTGDHVFSGNPADRPGPNYVRERPAFQLSSGEGYDLAALYLCRIGLGNDPTHFLSTDLGCAGFETKAKLGFLHVNPSKGTKLLTLYIYPISRRYLATFSATEASAAGMLPVEDLGYAWDPTEPAPTTQAQAPAPQIASAQNTSVSTDEAAPSTPQTISVSPPPPPPPPPPPLSLVPIARNWGIGTGDFLLTTDPDEGVGNGYDPGSAHFSVSKDSGPDLIPLYRCWDDDNKRHFVSPQEHCEGKANDGSLYFIHAHPAVGTRPLYRFWNPGSRGHLATIKEIEGVDALMIEEPVLGYVWD